MKSGSGQQVPRKKKYRKRKNTGTRTFKVAATTSQGSSGGQEGMLPHTDQQWVQLPLEFEFHQIKRQRHAQRKQKSERQRSETEIGGLCTSESSSLDLLRLPDASDLPQSENSYSTCRTSYAYNIFTTDISHAASTHYESESKVFLPSASPVPTLPDNIANHNCEQVVAPTSSSYSRSNSTTYSPPTSVYQEHGSFHHQLPGDIVLTGIPDINLGYQSLSNDIPMVMNQSISRQSIDELGWGIQAPFTGIPHYLTASASTSASATATVFPPPNTYSDSIPQINTYPSLSMNYGYTSYGESSTAFYGGFLDNTRIRTQPTMPSTSMFASISPQKNSNPDAQYRWVD